MRGTKNQPYGIGRDLGQQQPLLISVFQGVLVDMLFRQTEEEEEEEEEKDEVLFTTIYLLLFSSINCIVFNILTDQPHFDEIQNILSSLGIQCSCSK